MNRLKQLHKVQELVYELKIRDAVVREAFTMSPLTMMTQVRQMLRSEKTTAAPVIENGTLLGIVSVEDYINWLQEGTADCPVSERMSRDLVTMYDDEPMVFAIQNFEKYRYYEFPVINRKSGKLEGIITKFDVLVALLKALDIDYYKMEIGKYAGTHFFNDVTADQSRLEFVYCVPNGNIGAGGEVASKLKKNLGYLGIHPNIIRRVAIATYEAEMNIIIYGGGGTIRATLDGKQIRIEVIDEGPGIEDIDAVLEPGYSTAPAWVRELGFGAGMGLPNIKNSAQNLDITSAIGKGTKLDIVIPLEEP
jgi:anti-sigma regulatory factor (Ser/Thr protein kinase)/predicted transcriptional regulator